MPGVRLHACSAPPTLLGLLGAVLQSGRFGPGDVLEVLSALRAVATTVAVVGSVSRLEHPRPSMLQHLRSTLPGARFVVDVPGGRVLPGSGLGRLERLHAGAVVLAHAGDATSAGWATDLHRLTAQAPTLALDTPEPSAVPWRCSRWAEVTGLAVSIDEFATRLDAHLVRKPCPGCGFAVAGTLCPLCGVVSMLGQPLRTGPTDRSRIDARTDPGAETPRAGVPLPARTPGATLDPAAMDEGAVTVPRRPSGGSL